MFTNKKLFWIILPTLIGLVVLLSMPVGAFAEGVKISKVKFTEELENGGLSEKSVVTDLIDFIIPIDPLACEILGGEEVCYPMIRAEAAWICKLNPVDNPSNSSAECREILSSTLGAAWNTWKVIGGRWTYVYP